MSKLNTIKRDIDDNFTTINNAIVKDSRIDLKARGFYLTIMSLPANWDFSFAGIISIIPDGETAIRSAFNKLAHYGYASRQRIYVQGRIESWEYTFHQRPIFEPDDARFFERDELDVENLDVENLDVGFQGQLKTDLINDLTNTTISSETSEIVVVKPARAGLTEPRELIAPVRNTRAERGRKSQKASLASKVAALFDEAISNASDLTRLEPFQTSQPALPNIFPREKPVKTRLRSAAKMPVSQSIADEFARICFLAASYAEKRLVDKVMWSRIHNVIRVMQSAEVDLSRLHEFERWWAGNFRSKDKITRRYQPPRPEQIKEFWLEATADRRAQSAQELKQSDAIADDILLKVFQGQARK